MKAIPLATIPLIAALAATASLAADPVPAAALSETPAAAGWSVYVTNSAQLGGTPSVGRFANALPGYLTPVDNVAAGAGARGLVFTPDHRFAYLSNTAAGQVWMYRVAVDGALDLLGTVDTPGPFGIAIAPTGRAVYLANLTARTLTTFTVGSDGRLGYPRTVDARADDPKGVAVTPDGRYLYVSYGVPGDPDPDRLIGFPIRPDGYLGPEPVADVRIGASGAEVVITPNGRFVYVVCQGTDDVFGFRIGAGGSLLPVPGTPRPAGDFPEGAVVSPDGHRLFVAAVAAPVDDEQPGAVHGFTIGADGSLAADVAAVPMPVPIGLGFAPDGRYLYVSDFVENSLTTFRVGPAGDLVLVQAQRSGATADGASPAFHSVTVLSNRPG